MKLKTGNRKTSVTRKKVMESVKKIETMKLLGVKTLWWKIEVVLLFPLWFTSSSPTRKSWSEFKAGLIKHKHEFDYENSYINDEYKNHHRSELFEYAKCKHYGCNTVTTKDFEGNWFNHK